jgi:hypothetical protein
MRLDARQDAAQHFFPLRPPLLPPDFFGGYEGLPISLGMGFMEGFATWWAPFACWVLSWFL